MGAERVADGAVVAGCTAEAAVAGRAVGAADVVGTVRACDAALMTVLLASSTAPRTLQMLGNCAAVWSRRDTPDCACER